MEDLARRGLLYLDDGTSARSVAPQLALKDGVPFAAGDLAIDTSHDRGEILKKLDQLEATARAKGFAIGTGSAFQVTVDAVADWIGEAAKRGIEIVPVPEVERIIDTTGAGALFAAGFLFGLARGMPLATCGTLGHIAAGEVISHIGPRPHVPLVDLARKAGIAI